MTLTVTGRAIGVTLKARDQAIEDALYDHDLEVLEMPLSPNKLFELIQASKEKRL